MVKRQHIINLVNQETENGCSFSSLAFPDVTLACIDGRLTVDLATLGLLFPQLALLLPPFLQGPLLVLLPDSSLGELVTRLQEVTGGQVKLEGVMEEQGKKEVLLENIEYLELDEDDQDNIIEQEYALSEEDDVPVNIPENNEDSSKNINKVKYSHDQSQDDFIGKNGWANIVDNNADISRHTRKEDPTPNQNTDTTIMYHIPRKGMTFSDMDEAEMFLDNFSRKMFSPLIRCRYKEENNRATGNTITHRSFKCPHNNFRKSQNLGQHSSRPELVAKAVCPVVVNIHGQKEGGLLVTKAVLGHEGHQLGEEAWWRYRKYQPLDTEEENWFWKMVEVGLDIKYVIGKVEEKANVQLTMADLKNVLKRREWQELHQEERCKLDPRESFRIDSHAKASKHLDDWINSKHVKKETNECSAVIQEGDLPIKSVEDNAKEYNKENEINKTGSFLELNELEKLSLGDKTEEEYFNVLLTELLPLEPRKSGRPTNYEFMNTSSVEENLKKKTLFEKLKLRRFWAKQPIKAMKTEFQNNFIKSDEQTNPSELLSLVSSNQMEKNRKLQEGLTFKDKTEMEVYLEDFSRSTFSPLVKCRSKLEGDNKIIRIGYRCPHYTNRRRRRTKGLRNPKYELVTKVNCPVLVNVNQQPGGFLLVTKVVLEHQGHEVGEEHSWRYRKNRVLTREQEEEVMGMLREGVPPRHAARYLSDLTGRFYKGQDIRNLKNRILQTDTRSVV